MPFLPDLNAGVPGPRRRDRGTAIEARRTSILARGARGARGEGGVVHVPSTGAHRLWSRTAVFCTELNGHRALLPDSS